MPDHHSHNRGHLPVNRLFGGKEPVDLDDGLPSDTERVDRGSAILPADSQDPASASIQAQKPREPLEYAPPHIRALVSTPRPWAPYPGPDNDIPSSDNADIQAPADPAGDVLAELGALAATSAERERRRAAGDDGGGVGARRPMEDLGNGQWVDVDPEIIERRKWHPDAAMVSGFGTNTHRQALAVPGVVDDRGNRGASPVGDDFAAVPRNTTPAKSAMVRIMELTALVEQVRALAVQALTDIGSANQSELAAAHDRVAACERTITERDARIVALEAAAQSAIEKLAGGTNE